MFSSTRLHIFVCIALGISASAAPAGSGASIDARSPDVYDLSGGLLGFLLGAETQNGNSDEDTYILKRQLAGLDLGSMLGSNMGVQHAALLGEAGINLGNTVGTGGTTTKRDLYDLSGGVGALLLGLSGGETDGESDEYILKRQLIQLAGIDIGSGLTNHMSNQEPTTPGSADDSETRRDLYDLSGGIGALLFGGQSSGSGEDEYILKRDVYDLSGGLVGLLIGAEAQSGSSDEDTYILKREVEARSPDLYDLSGGVGALLFGLSGGETGGDSDEYILKRDGSEVKARSPDLYDLSGGVGALLFGLSGGETGGESDEYILKRQL